MVALHQLFRTKVIRLPSLNGEPKPGELKRVLTYVDLTSLGVGAIVGAGIFVLTGVAAKEKAGPAVVLSFLTAGIACLFSALCYSEFAARIPFAGSAYTYAYASFGEFPAFFIGWDLTLEYMIGSAAVARGWSGYFVKLFEGMGVTVPQVLTSIDLGDSSPGDPLAMVIVIGLTLMLARGIRQSSTFNHVLVVITIFIILFVIFAGIKFTDSGNFTPFLPFGYGGIFEGSAVVFFAFIGFDAVSTTAEEVKDPKKDLPYGICLSLLIATILYLCVSLVLVAMVPYNQMDVNAPLAAAFGQRGLGWAQVLISIGAFAALTTSVLSGLISQPRIYFSMARDGLLPPFLAKVHELYGTPINATLITGLCAAILAFFVDIEILADMVSIGTLFAFTMVNAGVLHLRYAPPVGRDRLYPFGLVVTIMISWGIASAGFVTGAGWPWVPIIFSILTLIPCVLFFFLKTVSVPDTFVCPWVPLVPLLGILFNVFMMAHLNPMTWLRLFIWLILGLIIYFGYSFKHSVLAQLPPGVTLDSDFASDPPVQDSELDVPMEDVDMGIGKMSEEAIQQGEVTGGTDWITEVERESSINVE